MSFNIDLPGGKAVKLPTAGKYCDRDIIVTSSGHTDADLQAKYDEGKQAEYDLLWNTLQNNGSDNGANYYYKFAYTANGIGWTDENFNPKYPLICASGATPALAIFYANKNITDTKVPIKVLGNSAQSMFATADNLVTIRELIVHDKVAFTSAFNGCYGLKNIVISGEIGQNIDLQHSYYLTKDSIVSVMEHLSTTATGKSVTFYKTAVDRSFETSEGAYDGSTSAEWAALANTRSNWTINLV